MSRFKGLDELSAECKAFYLMEIGENIISNEYLEDYILNEASKFGEGDKLQYLKGALDNIDLSNDYFLIDAYQRANNLSDSDIDEMFENKLDEIIADTTIEEDYPEIFEQQEDALSMNL